MLARVSRDETDFPFKKKRELIPTHEKKIRQKKESHEFMQGLSPPTHTIEHPTYRGPDCLEMRIKYVINVYS